VWFSFEFGIGGEASSTPKLKNKYYSSYTFSVKIFSETALNYFNDREEFRVLVAVAKPANFFGAKIVHLSEQQYLAWDTASRNT